MCVRDQSVGERLRVFRAEHARCFVQEPGRTLREDVGRDACLSHEDDVRFTFVGVVHRAEHSAPRLVGAADGEPQEVVPIALFFGGVGIARSVWRPGQVLHDHVLGAVGVGLRRVRRREHVDEVEDFPVAVFGFAERRERSDAAPRVDLVDLHEAPHALFVEGRRFGDGRVRGSSSGVHVSKTPSSHPVMRMGDRTRFSIKVKDVWVMCATVRRMRLDIQNPPEVGDGSASAREVRDHQGAAEVAVALDGLGDGGEPARVVRLVEELRELHPAGVLRRLEGGIDPLGQHLDVTADALDVRLEACLLGARDDLGLGGGRRPDELEVVRAAGVGRGADEDVPVVAEDDRDLAHETQPVFAGGDPGLLVNDRALVPAHVDEPEIVELAVLPPDADGVEREAVAGGEDEAPVAVAGDGEVRVAVGEGLGDLEEGHEAPDEIEHARAPGTWTRPGIQPRSYPIGSGSNRTYPEGRGAAKR